MLTSNEKKVLKYLLIHFDKEFSINEIARGCQVSPNGAYKILKKLEKENILYHKVVANVRPYKLNVGSKKTKLVLELALFEEETPEIPEKMRELSSVYIHSSTPVLVAQNMHHKTLRKYAPKAIILTEDELIQSLPLLQKELLRGKIFWGCKKIIEIFTDGT